MNDSLIFYTVLVSCDGFPVQFCAPPDYRVQTYPVQTGDPGESCGEFEASYGTANCCYVSHTEFARKAAALAKYTRMQQEKPGGLGLACQYIEGLNQVIKAGVDVRTGVGNTPVPVIGVRIDTGKQDLIVTFLTPESPCDKTVHVPLSTHFTVAFNDYPGALRQAGWK
jgi:hypothetical protein